MGKLSIIRDFKQAMGSISKAFRVDPGRGQPMPRKGQYQFTNTLINKKQQKPYTINPATLARLADSDPITWAIRRVIKGFISQTKWDIVPDIDKTETELNRWEDLLLNSINPYGFDDSVKFESKILEKPMVGEAEQRSLTIMQDETVDDTEKRARIRWYFKTLCKNIKQDAESHKHEVKCIFEHPNNTETSFRALMEMVLDDIMIYDSGIIVKNYSYYNKLAELYTLPGHQIKKYRNEDRTMPKPPEPSYVWEDQGILRAEFANDELLYIMQNPQQNSYGKSPLEVAALTITASLYADEYNIDYFKNSNVPPGIVNLGQDVTEDQRMHFQKLWEQEVRGQGIHKLLFAAGTDKMQFIPMRTMSNRDMQMMEYLKWATAIKCATYGISPQDIGFILDFQKNTGEVQERLSQARGVNSMLNLLECSFNEEIVKAEFPFKDVKFEWKLRDKRDSIQQAQIDNIDIQQGVVSINERRNKLGYKPIEGGDEYTVKGGGGITHVEDMMKQPEDPQPVDPNLMDEGLLDPSLGEPMTGATPGPESPIQIDGNPGRPSKSNEPPEPLKMLVNRKLKKKEQYSKLKKLIDKLRGKGVNKEIKIGFEDEKD